MVLVHPNKKKCRIGYLLIISSIIIITNNKKAPRPPTRFRAAKRENYGVLSRDNKPTDPVFSRRGSKKMYVRMPHENFAVSDLQLSRFNCAYIMYMYVHRRLIDNQGYL